MKRSVRQVSYNNERLPDIKLITTIINRLKTGSFQIKNIQKKIRQLNIKEELLFVTT